MPGTAADLADVLANRQRGVVLCGDCREWLRQIPDGSIHLCVTSPPYFGLRLYDGLPPSVWGGDPACAHEWGEEMAERRRGHHGTPGVDGGNPYQGQHVETALMGSCCQRCGAWRGHLGLEPSVTEYVAHLVEVLREVRRVLRDDGLLFLNLGDSYATSRTAGLKPKDLCGVPERAALALQADGWWWRSKLPWVKANSMPESVTDRPTVAHETWLMISKSARYLWDAEAVRVPQVSIAPSGNGFKRANRLSYLSDDGPRGNDAPWRPGSCGRNFRSTDLFAASLDEMIVRQRARLHELLAIRASGGLLTDDGGAPLALLANTGGGDEWTTGKHYATFPRSLIRPLIRGGASAAGCCPQCGAPWVRDVTRRSNYRQREPAHQPGACPDKVDSSHWAPPSIIDRGWRPSCGCGVADSIPCLVLDPFAGMATVAVEAKAQGLRYVMIEGSPQYAAGSENRIARAREQQVEREGEAVQIKTQQLELI